MTKYPELANPEKVASYRRSSKGVSPWHLLSICLSMAGYIGALVVGNSFYGWHFLVGAIACSFWMMALGSHMQEQEQTADLLEHMLDISVHVNSRGKERES